MNPQPKTTLHTLSRSATLVMTCACGARREESIGMLVEVGRFGHATPEEAAQDMQCPQGHTGQMTVAVQSPPVGWPKSFMGITVHYAGKIS